MTEGVLAGLASPRASGASIPGARQPRGDGEWWREAVIYQVYVRSFADANGDGIGDLAGVRSKLPYLRDLGVDATWFTPWYASPMEDGGYDVADYRAIDPAFGTLREAENLIGEALELASARSSISFPTTSQISTPGSRPPWPPVPDRPSGRGSGFTRVAATTATRCRRPGRRTSRVHRGLARPIRMEPRASGTSISSRRTSPT